MVHHTCWVCNASDVESSPEVVHSSFELITCTRLFALLIASLLAFETVLAQEVAQTFELETADGVTIYGEIH